MFNGPFLPLPVVWNPILFPLWKRIIRWDTKVICWIVCVWERSNQLLRCWQTAIFSFPIKVSHYHCSNLTYILICWNMWVYHESKHTAYIAVPNTAQPWVWTLEARSSIFRLMRFERVNGKSPYLFWKLNIVLGSLLGRKDQYILIFKMKAEVFL